MTADLPLEIHERTDPANLDPPCLLLVEAARDQRVGQRLISRETVRSLYESGVQSERNPEYDAAQVRVRQAERATKEKTPGILTVGDPLLDLVGLLVGGIISGFSQGSRERELDQATTALAATPRSLNQPVYRPYQFERQTFLAGKEATIPVALVDRANRRLWRAQLHRRERRQFEILDGLDPRDRDYEKLNAASVTRHDFERWQREPPQLQLSAIVTALREAGPAPATDTMTAAIDQLEAAPPASEAGPSGPVGPPPGPALADLDDFPPGRPDSLLTAAAGDGPLARPVGADRRLVMRFADDGGTAPGALPRLRSRRAGRPASPDFDRGLDEGAPRAAGDLELAPAAGPAVTSGGDPRTASVVRVNAGARAGSGVYVRSDLVLTTAQLVEGSSVVDIATADGARVLGLVARADRARNLALVQVARPGPPVALYDGPPVAAGRPVEAIALAENAGAVLTPGRYRSAGATSVLIGGAAGLAQVDVGSPPVESEGLPWFLGDRVVGVGTGTAAGATEGSLGTVPARDALDFLYGAGGALSKLP